MKCYAFSLFLLAYGVSSSHTAERPNILWITAEDMENLAAPLAKSGYGDYLLDLLDSGL